MFICERRSRIIYAEVRSNNKLNYTNKVISSAVCLKMLSSHGKAIILQLAFQSTL